MKIRWRLHLIFAAISIVGGFVIAFFMLGLFGNMQSLRLLELPLSAVLGAGAYVWGDWIREAVPEGGPAAFVALFILTLGPLLAVAIYLLLFVGNNWREQRNSRPK